MVSPANSSRYTRVNPVLGKRPNLGPIPGDLILPWGIILAVNFVIFQTIINRWDLVIFGCLAGASWHWLVSGDSPWNFWGYPLYTLPKWADGGNLTIDMVNPIKPKVVSKDFDYYADRLRKPWMKLDAFQDAVDLLFVVSYRIRNRRVGAYILNKGKSGYQVVFEFQCVGLSGMLTDVDVENYLESISTSLKDLLEGEKLTFHLGSFSGYQERVEELERLAENAPEAVQFLLASEKASVQQLAREGVRKPKFLRLYATYTVEPDGTRRSEDWSDNLVRGLESAVKVLFAPKRHSRVRSDRLEFVLQEAFDEGLLYWENLLSSKIGLEIRASDERDLWKHLCDRFCVTPTPPLPQLLVVSERGMQLHHRDRHHPIHPLSTLLGRGVPHAERDCVRLTRHHQPVYKGGVVQTSKPAGWRKLDQLKAGSRLVLRDDLPDVEVFVQLTAANPQLVVTATEEQLRHANQSAEFAADRRRKDVRATVATERAEAAHRSLIEGEAPINVAVVYVVERPTLPLLERACKRLANAHSKPSTASREEVYFPKIWLETLPICWNKLLHHPFNRRLTYTSSETSGLLPLSLPGTSDRTGVEFIADEGGTPVYIDIFNQIHHLLVLGITGSGKSFVVGGGFLPQALARGFKIVVMDYPRADGNSTFRDFTRFVGGAYLDISKEAINVCEPLDSRIFERYDDAGQIEELKAMCRDSIVSILLTVVNPEQGDAVVAHRVPSILNLIVGQYLADGDIQARARRCHRAGRGSTEWKNMPTLKDLIPFLTLERLPENARDDLNCRAIGLISLKLNGVLETPLGRAISRPSTIGSDTDMTVYALTNVSQKVDAAVLALSAYSSALRASIAHPNSIWFIDESPILFQFPEIPRTVANLTANGRKAGIRVILSAQDPNTIAQSQVASQILQNISIVLTGKVSTRALDSFQQILKYPRSFIAKNAARNFNPKGQPYRNFFLDYDGHHIRCRFYCPTALLALLANNPQEIEDRQRFLQEHPGSRYEALIAFGNYLKATMKGERSDEEPETDEFSSSPVRLLESRPTRAS